jgi:hypothetical protein
MKWTINEICKCCKIRIDDLEKACLSIESGDEENWKEQKSKIIATQEDIEFMLYKLNKKLNNLIK